MTEQISNDAVCQIRSTVDGDGRAACLMTWGPVQAQLTPEVTVATARDLMAAAVRAETDIALIDTFRKKFRADDRMLATVLTEVRGRRALPRTKVALRIEAVAGQRTGKPLVGIGCASMDGQLSPDEARGMAVQWIEAATSARLDVRLRYALGEWGDFTPDQVERLFVLIQAVQR